MFLIVGIPCKDFDKETEKYSFTSKGPGSRYKSGWSQLTKKK